MFDQKKIENVDASSEPRRDLEESEHNYLKKYFGRLQGRILDIGCGDGRLTRSYADTKSPVVGIDLDLDELKIANKTNINSKLKNLYYAVAKGEALPFARNSFNLAIFSWSL